MTTQEIAELKKRTDQIMIECGIGANVTEAIIIGSLLIAREIERMGAHTRLIANIMRNQR
jgi:phosphate uptake regulator